MKGKTVAILETRLGKEMADLAALFIFQTGVGTKALFAATDALGLTDIFSRNLRDARVAVRGPKPTGALRSRSVRIDYSAADPFTTREILQSLGDIPLQGKRVIIQRFGSATGRGEPDAAVFTNAEQLRNLFLAAEKTGGKDRLRDSLNRTLVASIGPVASKALQEAGVQVGLEASPPKLGALLSALDSALK